MRFVIALFFVSPFVSAKGLDGSSWKVKSFKLIGEEPSWTDEEAEAVKGQSVSFTKSKFKMGGQSCKIKITSATDDRRWTTGEINPCTDEKLRGNVYIVSYEDCDARFPGQIALPEPGQAVAFGDGVSFCLGK